VDGDALAGSWSGNRGLYRAPATTHWLAMGSLASYGAEPVAAPIVSFGKIITPTGDVSAVRTALMQARVLAVDSDPVSQDVIASRWY
jgi:hypothetical protein